MKDMDRFASIRDIPRLCCKIAVFFCFFFSGAFEGHHHFDGWQHRALQDFWGEFFFDCGVVEGSLHRPGMMLMQTTQKKFSIRTSFRNLKYQQLPRFGIIHIIH